VSNKYNPKIHHRKSIRIKKYDYSGVGCYFVTICAKKKIKYFGKIIDGKMVLNLFGRIVFDEWIKTKSIRGDVELDEFVVMPNHVHGIVIIRRGVSNTPNTVSQYGGVWQYAPTEFQSPSNNLGAIIRGFKSASTKQTNQQKINIIFQWQRNYYERIIRNENELNKIRKYIIENPIKWETEKDNSENLFM
jgi:REP element-mobilizing transposase RayT